MQRYNITSPAKAAQDPLDRPLSWTQFPDQRAKTMKAMESSLREMAAEIPKTVRSEKGKLPYRKLATFGPDRSSKGCLRHNANVVNVTGVEGDYDLGKITPEVARDRLEDAGVAALIYTTASHMQDSKGPRWRVLCPFSGPLPPEERARHLARLNGVLGGVLAEESFSLSQSYYAGSVSGLPPAKTFLAEGRYLDAAQELDAGAIYKRGTRTLKATKSAGAKTGLPLSEFAAALMTIPNDESNEDAGSRDWWLKIMAALHHETDGSEEGLELALEWSKRHPSFNHDHTVERWGSFHRSDGATGATILGEALRHGWVNRAYIDAAFDDLWTAEELAELTADAEFEKDFAELIGRAPKPSAEVFWGTPMMKGDKPVLNLFNTSVFLGRDLDSILPGLAHNLMTQRDEWQGGELNDAAVSLARMALERRGLETVAKELVQDAAKFVAKRREFHPIRDYYDALRWDGQPRADTWLIRHAGAEDSPYVRAVSRKFLIAMVARVMRPGCKHDHVLVLIGKQGRLKRSACRVLAGDDYFSDTLPSIRGDKTEAMRHLQGKQLVELAELAPSRKTDAEDLKAFLSGAVDRVRMPYAKFDQSFPRQCVFVGTTNEDQFLRDATGGRRFWPVTVPQVIDVAALAEERDQLFAVVAAAYRDGETWWLDPEFEAEHAAPVQAAAYVSDSWEEDVAAWLDNPTVEALDEEVKPKAETTVAEVLNALGVSSDRQSQANQKRAGDVLRTLGWTKHHTMRGKVWRRPEA
ncbi:MAG: VapE domain-containing protein [Pseudomonadota bacterium]|nr:VapE domain-containing protein [Pseudomonadota bacterium]